MTKQMNTVSYPAQFVADEEAGGYVVTFRDIPEAITQGDTLEEAKEMAAFALTIAFEYYREDVKQIPEPSITQEGDVLITVKLP